MKLLYKPLGIVAGVISAKFGQSVFKNLWARVDGGVPPTAKTEDATLAKIVAAQTLQAATLAGVAAAVDRMGMLWFHYLTGIWPGDKPAEDSDGDGEPAPEPVAA
jgi:hypothetical protein